MGKSQGSLTLRVPNQRQCSTFVFHRSPILRGRTLSLPFGCHLADPPKPPSSISDHMYRMAILAMLTTDQTLDVSKYDVAILNPPNMLIDSPRKVCHDGSSTRPRRGPSGRYRTERGLYQGGEAPVRGGIPSLCAGLEVLLTTTSCAGGDA